MSNGSSPDQQKYDRGWTVSVLNWAGVAIAFVCWIAPINPAFWLLVVPPLPLLAMFAVAKSQGRLKLLATKRQRSGVDPLVLLIPPFMVLRAMRDFRLIDWERGLIYATLIGIIYGLLGYVASDRGRSPRNRNKPKMMAWAFTGLIGIAYGWGLAVELNGTDQTRPSKIYSARITDKWVSGGKTRTPTFLLQFPNSEFGTGKFDVSQKLYDASATGDEVCLNVKTGILHLRWYVVTKC